jgi:hypothetical protein
MNRRRRGAILVAVLVLFINLPILHSTVTDWRIDRSGTQLTVEVVDHDVLTPEDNAQYWLGFRFPEEIDPDQALWTAQVEHATYDEAVTEGTVQVTVLDDNPAAYQVEGQVHSAVGLVTTLVADGILLLIVLLLWRFGRRSRPLPLRVAAIGDVERCPPGALLEQVEGTLYLVRGEVVRIAGDQIVLDVGERDGVVIRDGHQNPVGYQQPAQVRGRVVE